MVFADRDHRVGSAHSIDIAFTDRHGGSSPPPYDSLDMGGTRSGAAAKAVRANRDLVAGELGIETLVTLRQQRGAEVTYADAASADLVGDGVVTDRSGLGLCVRVADCVPVLLGDVDAGVIGAAHAGREGLYDGVVGATVALMREHGARSIEAWIGPSICGGCYEVPGWMRAEVAARHPQAYACTTWGTPALDLAAAVYAELSAWDCQVHDRSPCTFASPDLYSYRREGPESGRSAGIVTLQPAELGRR